MSESWRAIRTDKQKQALGWRGGAFDLERCHAMGDGADKVNVKDGVDVDKMEQDGDAEEAQPPESSHDGGKE